MKRCNDILQTGENHTSYVERWICAVKRRTHFHLAGGCLSAQAYCGKPENRPHFLNRSRQASAARQGRWWKGTYIHIYLLAGYGDMTCFKVQGRLREHKYSNTSHQNLLGNRTRSALEGVGGEGGYPRKTVRASRVHTTKQISPGIIVPLR